MNKKRHLRNTAKTTSTRNPKEREGEPISHSPLSGEDVLHDLLKIKSELKIDIRKNGLRKKRRNACNSLRYPLSADLSDSKLWVC